MADSNRQTDKQGDQNLREKGEKRKKRNKIELTTDKRGDQNLRENGEKGKGELLERWWFF